jgi:NTE family protein
MLPEGNVCLKPHAEGWRRIFGGAWPTNLWIAAVRLHDGQLVAFGTPDAPAVDVGTAVACSSAVPFVCAAVRVGPQRFIDGGIASATNLRLLAPVPTLSTVIVSSPLSRMPGMAARLRGEIGWLRRHGLEVIAFEPGPRTARAMGWNPLCWERGVRVAREAYAETVALLSDRAHPHRKAFERLMANHSEPESAMV